MHSSPISHRHEDVELMRDCAAMRVPLSSVRVSNSTQWMVCEWRTKQDSMIDALNSHLNFVIQLCGQMQRRKIRRVSIVCVCVCSLVVSQREQCNGSEFDRKENKLKPNLKDFPLFTFSLSPTLRSVPIHLSFSPSLSFPLARSHISPSGDL